MNEQPIVNIVGERVALGPLRRELVPLYLRWRNDFEVQRTFGDVPVPVTLEQRTAWFEDAGSAGDAHWFTIYAIEGWQPIGTTDLFEIDYRLRTARFGMLIGEADARGQGYGTETTRLMLDYAFTALGMHNVMLNVSDYNLAGRRAYEKAGFREFGRRTRCSRLGGRLWDLVYMECTADRAKEPRGGPAHPGS
jgi:RimJ/RimL family protein N-acetyltransferase